MLTRAGIFLCATAPTCVHKRTQPSVQQVPEDASSAENYGSRSAAGHSPAQSLRRRGLYLHSFMYHHGVMHKQMVLILHLLLMVNTVKRK
jgi:hypothetical protein